MHVEPLGESAWIFRNLPVSPARACSVLNSRSDLGIIEAVASYETVGIYVDPLLSVNPQIFIRLLQEVEEEADTDIRHHQVPVCYSLGEDLEEVAENLGIAPEEVVQLHCGTDYTCFAVGFCPGFPYLGYLPEKLAGIPRKDHPRNRVEPGSVAITGRQTGIYPMPRPGGWSILGHTPLTLVDVEERYFPIRSGDIIRFLPISLEDYRALKGERL